MKNSIYGSLDRALGDVVLSDERRENILRLTQKGAPRPARRSGRTILVAAAVAAVLMLSVLAISPTLRDTLSGLLGGFEDYTQKIEGVSATDQGIRITVLQAIADDTTGRYYLEIKDLTGDRLDVDTMVELDGNWCEINAYDLETHTALLEGGIKEFSYNEDGTISIGIGSVWGSRHFEGIPVPSALTATDNVLQSFTAAEDTALYTTDDYTVLVPNQTPLALEGTDTFTLSSMGYDENGYLHIQLAMAEGVEITESWLSIFFGVPESTDRATWYGGDLFKLEGGKYIDWRVKPRLEKDESGLIEVYSPEAFQSMDISLAGYTTSKPKVEGMWMLTFPLEPLDQRMVAVNQEINGLTVETVLLSALSMTLEGCFPKGDRHTLTGYPLAVYQRDGSITLVERGRSNGLGDGGSSTATSYTRIRRNGEIIIYEAERLPDFYFSDYWIFPDPVVPENVIGIALDQWYIPIEGGTALPGYWLTERPK